MKKLISILCWIVLINSSFAQNTVKIKKGEVAIFDGVLITEEKLIELDKAQRSNIALKDIGISKDEIIEFHKADARTQRNKLSRAEFRGFWTNTGYFLVGVLITGFTFKINQKIGDL